MEEIHENQLGEVLPYQFEPILNENSGSSGAESDSESESSSDDDFDEAFEAENSWRLKSFSWCKCGHCTLQTKTIESFCCHEKALEYDEFDALVTNAERSGQFWFSKLWVSYGISFTLVKIF
jgi:hypothetical protein